MLRASLTRLTTVTQLLVLPLYLLLVSGHALAGSYDVNANVPYDPTTQPAIFSSGLDGSTVTDALQTITGTCQQLNPASNVSIWRNGAAIGSTICNGSFSLTITLVAGTNTLLARTANASSLFGPDSSPVTMTLKLPDVVPPADPPANPQTETPVQQQTNTNAGAASDLTATPTEPFSIIDDTNNNAVTIHVAVGGGQTPYTIMLNWGDGSVDSRTVDQPGIYEFQHNYQTAGNYNVHGSIHDVLGASTVFEYAVMSNKPTGPAAQRHSITVETGRDKCWLSSQTVVPVAVSSGIAIVGVAGYWFGVHHAAQQLLTKSAHTIRPKKSLKKPPKRGKR